MENLIIPLDYVVLAIGSLIVIFCFWRGITSSILGLLTWLGSIIITIYFYIDLSNLLNSQFLKIDIFNNFDQITNIISTLISVPLIFLFSLFILRKIRKIISSDIDKQILGVVIDKFLGFLFGFIFNYIIFSTIIYFTSNFDFFLFLNQWLLDNSYLLRELDKLNDNLLNSIIGIEKEDIN